MASAGQRNRPRPQPRSLHLFLAGAGVKKGFSYGESDEFGFPRASAPWK